jgi:alkaline phosphatase
MSLRFKDFSSWNGKDTPVKKDKDLLQNTIDSVHRAGKGIRFWDAPDNEISWILQMKLGVDLIGTDKINELADFMKQ